MTVHLWALIGVQNSRKGSTIRALTGVARTKEFEVMLSNGQTLRIRTAVASINEPDDAPSADDWTASLCSGNERRNHLTAFRIDENYDRGYWPEDYLRAFNSAGGEI